MNKLTIFLLLLCSNLRAQQTEMLDYLPKNEKNYIESPIIIINLVIHVIQYSKSDPRNFQPKDSAFFYTHIQRANSYFAHLKPPTCNFIKDLPFIPNARVAFKIIGIKFHVDSALWDHNYTNYLMERKNKPWHIMSYNSESNTIDVDKNVIGAMNGKNSGLIFTDPTGEVLHFSSKSATWNQSKHVMTVVINEPITCDITNWAFSFTQKQGILCNKDLYDKYAQKDNHAVNLFYTGSSWDNINRGCGPTPYSVNVVNFYNKYQNNEWVSGSLLAHEFGHLLGLFHCSSKQMDDFVWKESDCANLAPSNNIMGPNPERSWLSPKQIAYIQQQYRENPKRIRTLYSCQYNSDSSIYINKKTVWNLATVVGGDIIICKHGVLTVNNMVSMPKGGKIIIKKGGRIIINAKITNNCGYLWQGIFSGTEKQNSPIINLNSSNAVEIADKAVLENITVH